jgi:hypothetical protein
MFKMILIGLAVVIILFVVIVLLQPGEFRVERSATMSALADAVFAQVNDFYKWEAWSPWAKIDPEAEYSYDGAAAGTGAIFRWKGNSEVGEGSLTILESRAPEVIRIRLDFIKPFEDSATTEFRFKGEGEKTTVTWSIEGKNDFIGKVMCLFMNMDRMIGDRYEEGLANIKGIVETPVKK